MKRWLVFITVFICLSGCGNKIEMSQLGVVAGLGIDQIEGGYRLTVQVVNPSYVAGKQPETLPVFSISSEGETLFDAYHELNSLTNKVLYLPHLSVIVIDEATAKEGINTVLDFVLRNVMIRPNITLTVANNATAQDVLHILTPTEQIAINQLDSLSNMCKNCSGRQVNYNLYEVSGMINDRGANVVLNSVAIIGDNVLEGENLNNILKVESTAQLKIDSYFEDTA